MIEEIYNLPEMWEVQAHAIKGIRPLVSRSTE